jgi:hypothetical protein
MTTKLILAFTVAAFALAGGSLAAPGNAFAEDGKPAATLSNPNADDKDKRRDRGYDWRSVYRSYRDRYESDSRRYRNQDWSNAERREGDHPRRKAKNDDADHGYGWRHSYRDRYEPDSRRYRKTNAPVIRVPSAQTVAAAPSCLTKEYLQADVVLFRDVCTKEWAMNSTSVTSQPVSQTNSACLIKQYPRANVVLFRDTCTNEWAMNPPEQQAEVSQPPRTQ